MQITDYQQFCAWCKEKRKALGYTDEQFAELTGMARKNIAAFESGKSEIKFPNLLRYLKALKIQLTATNHMVINLGPLKYIEVDEKQLLNRLSSRKKSETTLTMQLVSQDYLGEGCYRTIVSIGENKFKRLSYKYTDKVYWYRLPLEELVGDHLTDEEQINSAKMEAIFQKYCVEELKEIANNRIRKIPK